METVVFVCGKENRLVVGGSYYRLDKSMSGRLILVGESKVLLSEKSDLKTCWRRVKCWR